MRRIISYFLAFICTIMVQAQSLEVTVACEELVNTSVLDSYNKEFGKWKKPDLDDTFPYALIRIGLDGNEREVALAKQKVSLYLGRLTSVLENYKETDEILFLIPKRANTIYLECGDGCKPILFLEHGTSLKSNTIYYGRIHYKCPEEITTTSESTRQIENLKVRFDSLQQAQISDTIVLHNLKLRLDSLQQMQSQEECLILRYSYATRKLYGIQEYICGYTPMDQKELERFLQKNSPDAYKKILYGKQLTKKGWSLCGVGAGLIAFAPLGWLVYKYAPNYGEIADICVPTLMGAGGLLTMISVPLICIGYHSQNYAYDIYNYQLKYKSSTMNLVINTTNNGVGLALQF